MLYAQKLSVNYLSMLYSLRIQLLFLVSCFLIFNTAVIAQEDANYQKADSLISEETKAFILSSDSLEEIEEMIRGVHVREKNGEKLAFAYTNLYLQRGLEENNARIQYSSYYRLAFIHYNHNENLKVIKNGDLAYKAAKKMKDTLKIISAATMIGASYYNLGMYDESLQFYLMNKNLAEIQGELSYKVLNLANVANCRFKLERYPEALKHYTTVIETIKKYPKEKFRRPVVTQVTALIAQVKCYGETGQIDQALQTCHEGIQFSKEHQLPDYVGYFHLNLGYVHLKQKKYREAIGFIEKGKQMLSQVDNALQGNVHIANYYAALAYYELEEYENAIALLNTNFEAIGENINVSMIEDMYDLAIKIFKTTNQTDKQILYHDKLRKVTDLKYERKNAAKDILFESDIKSIEEENKRLSEANVKTAINKNVILIVSALLFLMLFLGFYVYRKKVKRDKQKFLDIIDEIENKKQAEEAKQKVKASIVSNEINDHKAAEILTKLEHIEETHFYLSQDCNLYSTAKLIDTNTTYLSKTLNEIRKQTFNQYLNELRINYILVKLKEDALLRSYTIRAISKEIGYKSHTTFIKGFKNKTGVTPAYYIKNLDLAK